MRYDILIRESYKLTCIKVQKLEKEKHFSHVVKYLLCVVSTHKAIAPYPYIGQRSASIMCYSLYGDMRTSASCCSWSVAVAITMPQALSCK